LSDESERDFDKKKQHTKDFRSRRDCYYNLFKIYNELNFDDLTQTYSKIYNDVFIKEKPLVIQRYFISEIKIMELFETS